MQIGFDIRVAARSLRREYGLALVVVLTLGVALGANSAVFSLIDRVALRPLPVEKPDELVMLTAPPLPVAGPSYSMSVGEVLGVDYPLFRALSDELAPQFSVTALRRPWGFTLAAAQAPVPIVGEYVSASYFRVLGLKTESGRTFTDADVPEATGTPVVVLNHGCWVRWFGSDRGVVGRTIHLNNRLVTVVGVLAPGYDGMTSGSRPELFVPLAARDYLTPARGGTATRLAWDAPGVSMYLAIARLRPGVEREQAERRLRMVYQRLLDQALTTSARTSKALAFYAANPPRLVAAGTVGSAGIGASANLEMPLRLVLAMTVCVLLVAAGNVANLVAARGARQRHELALRVALGARRWDLLRPRLLECVALALLSGCVALVLASWTGDLVPMLLGLGNDLAGVNTAPDRRVVLFTAGVSLLVGLVVWMASAPAATRLQGLQSPAALDRGTRSMLGVRRGLVVLQLAVSVVLVCTCTLLCRSLLNVLSTDPGFDAGRVVALSTNPGAAGQDEERLARYAETLRDQAERLPGVKHVALCTARPLSGGGTLSRVEGPRQRTTSMEAPFAEVVDVSAEYFATIGVPMIAGRAFDRRDAGNAPPVAIVNETLARILAPDGAIVGRPIAIDGGLANVEVVGVARDARGRSLKVAPEPALFRPLGQAGAHGNVSVLLRTETPNTLSASTATALVRRVDPGVALTEFGTVAALAHDALLRDRMLARFSIVFGALAATLAVLGVLAIVSFNAASRTRETAIRLALGASAWSIERLIVREAAFLVAAGLGAGLGLFLAANRVLGSLLFEVSANDPLTVGAAVAGVAAVTTMAGLLTARRAARLDPAVILRRV